MDNISPELWQPLTHEDKDRDKEKITRPSITFWQDTWRRLRQNKTAMFGLIVISIILLLSILGPWLSEYSYWDQDLSNTNQSPSLKHWFGTDGHGRDLFVRVLYGARISLAVGLIATLVNFVIGILYGGISGYFGGNIDTLMMRIVDIISTIPLVLYAILLIVIMGQGLLSIIVALSSVYWVRMARIVRGQILSIREQEFVIAAKSLGASPLRILLRHLIPNTMGTIIVTMTLMIPEAIFTESFLSFIGIGISAPKASWGSMAAQAIGGLRSYPYQLFFPSAAICITMIAFNLFGDGLRDVLDPRLRK